MPRSPFVAFWCCLLVCAFTPVFAQKPELVLQTGHVLGLNAVAISPDGKLMASGSEDKTVKLWDLATGHQLRSLQGQSGAIDSLAFNVDGSRLASCSNLGRMIKIWDVTTGQTIHTLVGDSPGYQLAPRSIAYVPHTNLLANGEADGSIRFWDLATGKTVRTIKGPDEEVRWIAFSPDGTVMATPSPNWIQLWNVSSGSGTQQLFGHVGRVDFGRFSADGTTLITAGWDKKVKLWDVSSGQPRTDPFGQTPIALLALSPDAKTVGAIEGGKIKLWDLSTARELRPLADQLHTPNSLAFSPDGKTLVSGSQDKTFVVWDIATGSALRTLGPHVQPVNVVAFSPDGTILATTSQNNSIRMWDLVTGQPGRAIGGHTMPVLSLGFSQDGKYLASGSEDRDVKIWSVATGELVRTIEGAGKADVLSFSPDGKLLGLGMYQVASLWDVATAKQMTFFPIHDQTTSVVFSSDGKAFAAASLSGQIEVVDLLPRTSPYLAKAREVLADKGFLANLAFSPDSQSFTGGSAGVKFWDLRNGQSRRNIQRFDGHPNVILLSPDGKTLVSGGDDKLVKVWDVATGHLRQILGSHADVINSLTFNPSGTVLASASRDGTVKLWRMDPGKELATLVFLDTDDWVAITPGGLFDGSPDGWDKLIWRNPRDTLDFAPVEAYFGDFYYPGLLTDLLSKNPPVERTDVSRVDRRQPQLELATPDSVVGVPVTSRNISVKVEINNAPAGAQDVRLMRNGLLVKVWRGDVLQGKDRISLEATLPLVAGNNRIAAYAFNRDNIKSTDAVLNVTGADSLKRKGVAHVIAVGINSYANPAFNLRYAVPDAQDFAEEWLRQQTALSVYDHVELIPLVEQAATKRNILLALKRLAGGSSDPLPADAPSELQKITTAQPEDAVVIYFSGHGIADGSQFFLIPYDLGYAGPRTSGGVAANLSTILEHSVSDRELGAALETVDAGRMLLVIDACNSGQILESEEKRRGPMNSKGVAQLAYEKGIYILTASQSYQVALETSKLGHGYLTYALVDEGLKASKADRLPKDGQVVLREWLEYAAERVPEMQLTKAAAGNRLLIQQNAGTQPTLRSQEDSVQRPRVFYRREIEPIPMIVGRSPARQ